MRSMPHASLGAAIAALLALTPLAPAGDIDPPSGAVEGTMKTIREAEPRTVINIANTPGDADSIFKITQPGSYYLEENYAKAPASPVSVIEIAADNVTIDLRGFALIATTPNLLNGITTSGPVKNIHIHSGTITGFTGEGIFLDNAAESCRIDNLRIDDCALGIFAGGSACRITDCFVSGNDTVGIWAAGSGSTIARCTAADNGNTGMIAGDNATISNSTAHDNAANGISISSGVISNCAAGQNEVGFTAQIDALVESCTARGNSESGIIAANRCVVRDNLAADNGPDGDAAGIHISGDDNRIEANHCTQNTNGITIAGTGNTIIRNTATNNTASYVFAASNTFGPIVNVGAGGDLSTITNGDNPWANFRQ